MCCPGLKMRRSKSVLKKLSHVLFSPPPPVAFIHIPFEVLRVIINDAFCEAPHATIHSALKATVSGTHVTAVMGETQQLTGMGPGPLGGLGKSGDPLEGEVFRTYVQPAYHPHGPLWGIEFSLAPAPKPN